MTEEELLEIILTFLPESLEGWIGTGMALSAVLSLILPAPADDSHPAYKVCHRAICIFGLGASKLRAAGKLGKLAKIGAAIGRRQ